MGNWTGIAAFLALIFPLAFGILSFLVKKDHLRHIFIGLIASLFFFSLFFIITGDFELHTNLSFFSEPITLSFSRTPNIFYLIVIIALGLKIFETNHEPNENLLRVHNLILGVSLAFGFIAFFSGQFMIRYIALEMVGLMVALTALDSVSNLKAYTRFAAVFLILRLGDIGLWSSILILQNHTGNLNISEMITTATALPLPSRTWVLAGFLFAVLIKTAAWPLGLWLQFIETKKKSFVLWVPRILMPSLGLYLLYRIRPILQSHPAFGQVIALTVLILTVALVFSHLLGWVHINRRLFFFTITTGMAIYLSTLISSKTLSYYLWISTILRLPSILKINLRKPWFQITSAAAFLSLNAVYAVVIWPGHPPIVLAGWIFLTLISGLWYGLSSTKSQKTAKTITSDSKAIPFSDHAQIDRLLRIFPNAVHKAITRFSQRFEINFINHAFPFFSRAFTQSASFAKKHFENNLEQLWQSCVSAVVKISEGTFAIIESSFDGLWDTTSDGIIKLSESTLGQIEEGGSKRTASIIEKVMRRLNTQDEKTAMKSFRWDLIWIPVFLVIVLIFVLTS
jgi:hypothetical protein